MCEHTKHQAVPSRDGSPQRKNGMASQTCKQRPSLVGVEATSSDEVRGKNAHSPISRQMDGVFGWHREWSEETVGQIETGIYVTAEQLAVAPVVGT